MKIMPDKRIFWFFFFSILLQLGSMAQVSKLSKEDQKIFNKAVNGMEKDAEQSLSDFKMLKSTYVSNIDVCFYYAECYYKLKMWPGAYREYTNVISLIKTAKTVPELEKDVKLKEHYEDLLKRAKSKKDSSKEFIDSVPTPDSSGKEVPPDEPVKPDDPKKESGTDTPSNPFMGEYADEGFIDFKSTDPAAQKAELKAHVESLYKAKFEINSAGFENSGKNLMVINRQWLKANATSNYEWFERFKLKEDTLFRTISQYNDEKDRRRQIESQIVNYQNRLGLNLKQLDYEKADLKNLENHINTEITDGMVKKLATIPLSIVMIGRMAIPKDVEDEAKISRMLSDSIDNLLKIKAIEKIQGFTYQKTNFLYQDKLNSIFVKTLKGKAKTTDTYYRRILKTQANGEKFLYKIIRIEVNPYDTVRSSGGISASTSSSEKSFSALSDSRFAAFRVDTNCSILQIDENGETRVDESEVKFKKEEKDYINFLCDFSNSLNKKYQEKIEQAALQFEVENQEAQIKRDTILKRIDKKNSKIAEYKNEIKSRETQLDNTKVLEDMKAALYKANVEYEAEYKSKTTLTNQLSNESSESSTLADVKIFSQLSDECYRVTEDIKRNEVMISVTKIIESKEENIRNNKYSMIFEAVPKSYMVLSINKVKPSEESEVTLFLNIAFKISYNTKEVPGAARPTQYASTNNTDATSKVSPPVNTQKTKAPEPVDVPKPVQTATPTSGSFVIDESQRTMTENSTRTRWKVFHNNPTSYTAYMAASQDVGYSLPNFNELKEFFNKIAYQESIGNTFFSKLFSFEGKETAIFATSEKVGGEQVRCLKIILPGYQIQEELLDEGEIMNIISLNRRY